MKYEEPDLAIKPSAVDSIRQRLEYAPAKICENFLDLYTFQVTSELTTLACLRSRRVVNVL